MQTRRLGPEGPQVSALGLGTMGMSFSYGPRNDAESEATLRLALDRGVTFFDTADIYGDGHNETLLASGLGGDRHKVLIATKFGNVTLPDGSRGVNGRPEYVEEACNASLQRLGRDFIDLYYLHRVDPETPIEETVGAMGRLVEAGKVRWIGLSEAASATIRRAQAVHPLTAVQSEYSLWTRDPEQDVLQTCQELGLGFVAYSPIGRGFLSGQLRDSSQFGDADRRPDFPRFQGENLKANLGLADRLAEMAQAKGCSAAQLAIAWVLSRGEHVVPIPGTKRRNYLEENLESLDVTLSAAELTALDQVFRPDAVAGERFPPGQMKRVNL